VPCSPGHTSAHELSGKQIAAGAAAAVICGSLVLERNCMSPPKQPANCEVAVSPTHDLRVVQYNVLSPKLCRASMYTKAGAEDLAEPVRFQRVVEKLRGPMGDKAIIALQEVDLQWAGKLHVLFAEEDYVAVFAQYGSAFSGYMGVMLAWPRSVYEATAVEIARLSDEASESTWPKTEKALLSPFGFLTYHGMREVLGCAPQIQEPQRTSWHDARDRKNEAILAKLRPRSGAGQSFSVATYHMPCCYGPPEKVHIVNIHTLLLLGKVREFTADDPAVILGDFNFMPDSSPYAIVCAGDVGVAGTWPRGETVGLETLSVRNGGQAYESAYRVFHKSEPLFTNFTETGFGPFQGTLDYIWFTPGSFVVTDCRAMPSSAQEMLGPCPNPAEPSDHLLLDATLRFT